MDRILPIHGTMTEVFRKGVSQDLQRPQQAPPA
jgi:hypothetical protein